MHVGIPKPLGLCSKINYHFVGSGRGFQQLHNNDNESPSGVGHRKIAKYSSGERESGLSYWFDNTLNSWGFKLQITLDSI